MSSDNYSPVLQNLKEQKDLPEWFKKLTWHQPHQPQTDLTKNVFWFSWNSIIVNYVN